MVRFFLLLVFIAPGFYLSSYSQSHAAQRAKTPQKSSQLQPFNNIRNYLNTVSAKITDSFNSDIVTLNDWKQVRPQRYQDYLEMLGIDHLLLDEKRTDLNVKITGTIQEKGYKIVKLYFESLPGLYVPANLYIPDNIKKPMPAILYVCGHSPGQQVRYQAHPRKFAQLGFVCLIIENIQFGEVSGHHWGPYSKGWFNWYSTGYNPGGAELWNGIRAIDLLSALPEVNPEKIGVTGISGGGSQSWYIAAADPRVKAAAPVCGAGTLKDHILNRTVDGHCDCMMPTNTYQYDFTDIGALIAPKPLLICQANRDEMYRIESVRELEVKLKKTYKLYGKPENISLVETPGPHSYHKISRERIFSFFMEHLMDKKVSPDQAGDVDESPENMLSPEELRVFVDGPPRDDRTTSIQNSFMKLASSPFITTETGLYAHRDSVKKTLLEKTFGAFPKKQVPLDGQLEIQSMTGNSSGNKIYSYLSEEGWRLKIIINWKDDPEVKKPLMIVLRNYDEDRWSSESFASSFNKDWNVAYLDVRGIGETGWDPGLQWHIRRASAWTGRTIASMQVYDVLRGLTFCRTLPGIDTSKIGIAAMDEMGVVALYASLLDGNCNTVILQNPPSTQNVESNPTGKGTATEMLNCLQILDVYQLPALIWPTKTIFLGDVPKAYQWSDNTLERLGKGRLANT